MALLLVAGCSTPAAKPRTRGGFVPGKLREIDEAVLSAIRSNRCPGGVLWLGRDADAYVRAYGSKAVNPARETAAADTVYDLASLTKVLATTPAVMRLVESGRVGLEEPVARYLPEFAVHGKQAITVRHLLTHASGLRPGLGAGDWAGKDTAYRLACEETPQQPPDTKFTYSDINFIVLGALVERVSGEPLDVFCAREFFGPLGMRDTRYLPSGVIPVDRIAPTECGSGGCLRGVVHDPTARRMGGVAGHAGLFGAASDLARFCRMMLGGGELDGVRVFQPGTVALMTSVATPGPLPLRGLGWDIDSPYAGPRGDVFPVGSYGHSGWTGTSLWIDPSARAYVIFLSNRNHPSEEGNVIPLRRRLGTLAAEALAGVRHETGRRDELVRRLGLRELPLESGRFREQHVSALEVLEAGRPLKSQSSILYFLDRERPVNFLHRLKSDDTHVLCEGGPVDYFVFHPDGRAERVTLGSDLAGGQRFMLTVPAGAWKALRLRPEAGYVLLANVLSPQWLPDRVEVGAGREFVDRYAGRAPWATSEFLEGLMGPNRK